MIQLHCNNINNYTSIHTSAYVGVALILRGCGYSMQHPQLTHACIFCQLSSSENVVSSRDNIPVKNNYNLVYLRLWFFTCQYIHWYNGEG